ncbi:TPA: hypothetical protein ACH3X1_016836 [Trebouxia sp. C0004]
MPQSFSQNVTTVWMSSTNQSSSVNQHFLSLGLISTHLLTSHATSDHKVKMHFTRCVHLDSILNTTTPQAKQPFVQVTSLCQRAHNDVCLNPTETHVHVRGNSKL